MGRNLTVAGTLQPATDATVALYQTYVSTVGTWNTGAANNDHLNDNNVATNVGATIIGQYGIVSFGRIVNIERYRFYGSIAHVGDGRWTIQYWNLASEAWVDWVTDIPTHTLAGWSDYGSGPPVQTTAVKIICQVVDTGVGTSYIYESEIIK